ncbi:MAG: ROK family protein [Bryobacterales bacterium]|nr:ROK family protein [Bryobacterales bacterium]
MARYAIGLDLGGTNLRAAAIDASGQILHKVAGRTDLSAGADMVIGDMVDAIDATRRHLGETNLAGIGVGVPGFIIMEKGIITDSPNLPGFENYPVRDALEERLGCRVHLENDANAAALGEKWMGAGREVEDLVLLTLGTGIGGGVICGGRVVHGFVGMGGELGHITVNPTGNPCGCGNRGCLEKHASATAITAMAKLMGFGDGVTAEAVYRMAVEGNDKAVEIYRVMGESLGIALANLSNIFNFPLYLLSGGVLAAWDFFAPPMFEECRRRSFVFRNTATRIEKASLGNQAGLFGAASLGFP